MEKIVILTGLISLTANLVMGGLFVAFWLRDRPGRWNLAWGVAYLSMATGLGLWLTAHNPAVSRVLLDFAGVVVGVAVGSFIAGAELFLERPVAWWRLYSIAIIISTAGILLLARWDLRYALAAAASVIAAAHAWGGICFLRQTSRITRWVGAVFLARALQLSCFVPLVLMGHGEIAFLMGHFMTLATGFAMLFVAFVDYDRRLLVAKQELAARNTALIAQERTLTETNQTLSAMTQKLETQSIGYAAARDRAEAASHAKSQFLANMSHELRTPLNAILGFSELITLREDLAAQSGRAVEYAGYIRDAGSHLLAVLNDLLDIARIELNTIQPALQALHLITPVESAVAMLGFALEPKQVTVVTAIPRDLAVSADGRLLKQAVMNLVGNAIKYSPVGGRIDIAARPVQGDVIEMTIADQGPGIAVNDREAAFQPFWQKAGVETREQGGVGLGLSIVRLIIEAHRGTVAIEDCPGGGTRIVLRLPGNGAT